MREAAAKFEHSEPRGRIDCSFRCSFTKGEFVYSVGVFGQLSSRVLRNSTAQMLVNIWGEYRNGIEDRTYVCALINFNPGKSSTSSNGRKDSRATGSTTSIGSILTSSDRSQLSAIVGCTNYITDPPPRSCPGPFWNPQISLSSWRR